MTDTDKVMTELHFGSDPAKTRIGFNLITFGEGNQDHGHMTLVKLCALRVLYSFQKYKNLRCRREAARCFVSVSS